MQFEIYQWLVPLIAGFFLFRVVAQFRQHKRSLTVTVIWAIFWATIIVLALIPNPVSFKIAELLGFKSNINAVIFVALGLLFLLVFYLFNVIERLERQITELIRKLAIYEAEKETSPEDEPTRP
jgi:hypothetical protein